MTDLQIYRTIPAMDQDVSRSRREITAYAAAFDQTTEIRDQHGHYTESLSRSSFNRSLSHIGDQLTRVKVLFNHGKNLDGTPAERFAMPIGVPLSITADAVGLRTVTRISETPLGDEVLELARDGAVTGFSFTGRIFDYSIDENAGTLPHVTRTELGLTEYGPGVFVAYPGAEILAVRTETPDAERVDVSSESHPDAPTPSGGGLSDGVAHMQRRARARARTFTF